MKDIDLKGVDLVAFLPFYALVSSAPNKPGAVIKQFSEKMRENLKKLTSDDFRKVRFK